MTATAAKKTSKAIGYLRVALVLLPTLMLVALGFGIAHATAPSAGDTCSVRNATTHDGNGKTMWCNPTQKGGRGVVWRYSPSA